jgi:polyisoprenoid-binding protein YceI
MQISDLPQMRTTTTTVSGSATTTPASTTPPAGTPATVSGTATTVTGVAATVPPTPADTVDGAYRVGNGSEARYGINDNVLGNSSRVVGRTNQVTGTMTIAHQILTTAKVVVDMRSVRCNCVHDSKYNDLLDTQQYPTSQFVLTTPIPIASIPAEGMEVRIPVAGQLTIHGRTNTEHFTLTAARQGHFIAVHGDVPVELGKYGIQQPSAGPFGGIDNADIELLILWVPAA